jgi:hypothetical protein
MWMKMMMGDGWMCSEHSKIEGGRQRGDGTAGTQSFGLWEAMCMTSVEYLGFVVFIVVEFLKCMTLGFGLWVHMGFYMGLHGHGSAAR